MLLPSGNQTWQWKIPHLYIYIYTYWFSHWNLHLVCELSSQPRLTTRGYLGRFSQDRSSRSNFVEVSTCDSLTGLGLFTSSALLQALGRWGIGERMLNIIPNSHDVSTNKIWAKALDICQQSHQPTKSWYQSIKNLWWFLCQQIWGHEYQ